MSKISMPLTSMPPVLAAVATPTVTPQGTGGAATWGYEIVGVKANGSRGVVSTEGTTAVGNATLDGTNFNRVTWTDVAGYATYEIWRSTSGGTPATTGLIGTVAVGVQTFDDTGLAITAGATQPAADETGNGDEFPLQPYNGSFDASAQDIGTGTYQLQGTYGGNWIDEGTALTADGVRVVTNHYTSVRWRCTAFTSGTPTSWIAGDSR